MKSKRIISGLLALSLVFGAAAALPQGAFTNSICITASAEVEEGIVYQKVSNKYAMVTGFNNDESTTCVIPEELGGLPVEVIAEGAFKENTTLQTIDVPISLRSIANSAFEGCTALTTIEGFSITNLTNIGDNAFKGCTSLKINKGFPRDLEKIGISAFEGCTSIKYLTVPRYLEKISQSAFKNCTSLQKVTISDGVETIAYDAFLGCTSLKSVTIPESVKTIGAESFENCSSLESITIPDNVKNIYFGTFKGCSNLTSVTIPDGVERIDAYAFTDCENLKRIIIPKSVKTFGFNQTTEITPTYDNPICDKDCTIVCRPGSEASIYAESNGNNIQYYCGDYVYKKPKDGMVEIAAYLGNDSTITIPSTLDDYNVSSFGIDAFHDCTSLESVTIPDSVTTMKDGAFMGCSNLKSMTVPNSVTKLGTRAFGYVYDDTLMPVVNPDFTVKCYKDSAADEYAKKNGIKIEYVDVKHVAEKAPTCAGNGNREYWTWNGKYYSDALCTKEITKKDIVLKRKAHDWGEPTWTWSKDYKSCTVKFTCSKCSDYNEFDAYVTSETTAATSDKDGKTVYTAKITYNGKSYTDTKTVTIKKTSSSSKPADSSSKAKSSSSSKPADSSKTDSKSNNSTESKANSESSKNTDNGSKPSNDSSSKIDNNSNKDSENNNSTESKNNSENSMSDIGSKPSDNSETDSIKPEDSSKPDSKPSDGGNNDDQPTDGEDETIMLGDVNGDGEINVTDIAKVAAHIKGIKALDEKGIKAADVNGDGEVNVTDIAKIAAHIKGIKAIG